MAGLNPPEGGSVSDMNSNSDCVDSTRDSDVGRVDAPSDIVFFFSELVRHVVVFYNLVPHVSVLALAAVECSECLCSYGHVLVTFFLFLETWTTT
jgi:hypothetical protein